MQAADSRQVDVVADEEEISDVEFAVETGDRVEIDQVRGA